MISSMGAGNKVDPTAFEVTDIYKTSVCPLAKVMRYELKRRGIKQLKVVYSKEPPITPMEDMTNQLPHALYLSAGHSTQMHPAQTGARKQRFCSICSRIHHRRRGDQGSDRICTE